MSKASPVRKRNSRWLGTRLQPPGPVRPVAVIEPGCFGHDAVDRSGRDCLHAVPFITIPHRAEADWRTKERSAQPAPIPPQPQGEQGYRQGPSNVLRLLKDGIVI